MKQNRNSRSPGGNRSVQKFFMTLTNTKVLQARTVNNTAIKIKTEHEFGKEKREKKAVDSSSDVSMRKDNATAFRKLLEQIE